VVILAFIGVGVFFWVVRWAETVSYGERAVIPRRNPMNGSSDAISTFRVGLWLKKILGTLLGYIEVDRFLSDPKALTAYLGDKRELFSDTDRGMLEKVIAAAGGLAANLYREVRVKNIGDLHKLYNRQMAVIAASYVELILGDFFLATFQSIPAQMRKFVSEDEKSEGRISLTDVVKFNSRPEILRHLAERATGNALKGKFAGTLKHLDSVATKKLPEKLKTGLIDLNNLRNRVVHELSEDELDTDNVKENLRTCVELLHFLGAAANDAKIALDDPNSMEQCAGVLKSLTDRRN
jgi:hypothetical protein